MCFLELTHDYRSIPGLRLPKVIVDQSQWIACAAVFETYLRSVFMAHKFWNYGKIQPPAFIVLENNSSNSNYVRNLGIDLNATNDEGQSSQTSTNQSSTPMRKKCRLVKDHPMYYLFINNTSVANIQIAVDFYNRMMEFILDVLRYALSSNDKANNVLATYVVGDTSTIFKLATEINTLFLGQCSMESRSRRYQFGNLKFIDSKCKTFDEFIAYMFEERRWIQANYNEFRSDAELLDALINGVSGNKKYLSIYNFLLDRQKPGQEVQIDVVLEQLRNFNRQNEFLEATNIADQSSESQIVSTKTRTKRDTRLQNQHNYMSSKFNDNEYFVAEHLKHKFKNVTCNYCGVLGHKSYHHRDHKKKFANVRPNNERN